MPEPVRFGRPALLPLPLETFHSTNTASGRAFSIDQKRYGVTGDKSYRSLVNVLFTSEIGLIDLTPFPMNFVLH
jgi:hypothetical protein